MDYNLSELFGSNFPETSPNIAALVALFGFLSSLFLVSRKNFFYQNMILVLSLCLSAFAILATQSRSALLALTGAILVVYPRRKKILLPLIVVAVILATGFMAAPNHSGTGSFLSKVRSVDHLYSMRERFGIWLCYAEIIKDHPFVGVGFGMQTCYDEKMLIQYNQKVDIKHRMTHLYVAPHNMLVDTGTRVGLTGLALFLYAIFAFLGMGWRLIRNGHDEFNKYWGLCLMGAFIAVFIQGMFENTLSGPPAVILYVIFAMMTILWRMQNEPASAPQNDVQGSLT
jgi:O-antigen ligase